MMIGASLIKDERMRQVGVEGWTEEHDLGHNHGEMVIAAVAYLMNYIEINEINNMYRKHGILASEVWPWEEDYYKPEMKTKNRKDLVRAGALIAAEIDRLINLYKKEAGEEWLNKDKKT